MLHASLDRPRRCRKCTGTVLQRAAVPRTLESLCSEARRGRKLQRLGRDLICYEACSISQASGEGPGERVFRVDLSSEFEVC